MTHEHHGLELFRGLQSNADHYQYAGGAEHGVEAEGTHEQRRDYCYQHKEERTEQSQAVAYLDDGTMIVVEEGYRHIGKSTTVVVTSVLQTSAGRMIFAKPKDE